MVRQWFAVLNSGFIYQAAHMEFTMRFLRSKTSLREEQTFQDFLFALHSKI